MHTAIKDFFFFCHPQRRVWPDLLASQPAGLINPPPHSRFLRQCGFLLNRQGAEIAGE
ncbi:hypothetical protein [Kamptonema formosum]|uniref:hypothetical protein n=1 Tax=Kamptonema formosum TaxID=331992 RepID=UPI0012DEFAD3|nr:hypothetical protein [Oscillatoria sp. PCC 10802]